MKQKMTALDVRALVILLKKKLFGLRLANVYDVSGRLYLLKFSKANRKEHLLIESGIRIHTTDFLRNKKDVPSGFTMKLRKHLRTKKLDNIQQLGIDRVIDLTFGKGENSYHILVELYASGNVILTDHEYVILSLLRSHKFDENSKIQIREKYPFTASAGLTIESITIDPEEIKKFIQGEVEVVADKPEGEVVPEEQQQTTNDGGKKGKSGKEPTQKKLKDNKKQQEKKKEINLKSILTKMVPYINFPYAEHVLKEMNLDPNGKATDDHIDSLIKAARQCQELAQNLEKQEQIKGFVVYTEKQEKEKKLPPIDIQQPEIPQAQEDEENSMLTEKFKNKIIKDFGPIMLNQFQNELIMEYESFDQCVDEYFSQLDKQRESSKFTNKEEKIWEKMSRIKDDQEKRISGLQKEQDFSEFKAQLLQKHIYEIQAIIDILQVMQTSGISWNDISRMIKEEKKAGNPLANLIFKMNFEKNSVTLILDAVNEEDEDSNEFAVDERFSNFDPVVKVDVDLHISAQMNIKKYFEIKKKSYEKELKTKTAAQVAIKDAEVNALKEITKHRQTQKIDRMRKVFWFEKFDWFISSENYLVISGRNAQQNEALVKKYMGKGDLFMHTDMPGAATTVIKNPSGQIVPPMTLNEAACFELCHSRAWDSKIVTEVYWVNADQVSKTAPTGLYISTGSFMIRGKRNFITPNKLELGFTLMFALNEESIPNHIGERKPRLQQDEQDKLNSEQFYEEDAGEDQVSEMSREPSIIDQEMKVVQVGEDKEAMMKKQKQQHQKNIAKREKQGGKDKDGKKIKKVVAPVEEVVEQGKPKALPRGKKAKIQKMKDKYADQDEDERIMRMQLLGAKKVKGMDKLKKPLQDFSKKHEEKLQKEDVEQEVKEEEQTAEPIQEKDAMEVENQDQEEVKVDQQQQQVNEEQDQEFQEVVEDNKDEDDKAEEVDDEEEKKEIDQLMKEEDINVLPEDVDVNEIDKLTGIPKHNDIIIGMVPMCAPYTAITTYKYKVKIQPGTLKRGKAQKLIKNLFVQQCNKNVTEANQIKNIPDADMMNILINNVRVLAPGLTKLQNQTKQDKRKKPKAQ